MHQPSSHPPALHQPCVIIGMMAAGKTTLGLALAAAINTSYSDSDEAIEVVSGRHGRDVAASQGVEQLHALEAEILIHQLDQDVPGVISAAASVMDSEVCRALLKERATVCWVDVPVEVLEARTNRDDHRRPMQRAELQERYDTRIPLFEEVSDIRVDGLTPLDEQVAAILDVLGRPFVISDEQPTSIRRTGSSDRFTS